MMCGNMQPARMVGSSDNVNYGKLAKGAAEWRFAMLAHMDCVMFLQGTKGEFDGADGRKVEYQNAEFFQRNGGGSVKFAVDREIDVDTLVSASLYDLTVDVSQFEYQTKNGARKAFRCRVVDVQEHYGEM